MNEAYGQEVEQAANQALYRNKVEAAFRHLVPAHRLAQRMTSRHPFIDGRMPVVRQFSDDGCEAAGQVPRGNTAQARGSASFPMPVPADLLHVVP